MNKRTLPRPWLAAGVGFVVLAVLWMLVAPGLLVKYPRSVNATPRYAGTFTLFVNPTTGAPLAGAQQLPLTVDRALRGTSATSSTTVVDETITQKAGPLTLVQKNAYVMDRKSLKNLKDSRAYAFDPSNVVDRSGTYRLNLPFDTSESSTYLVFKNEITTPYQLHSDKAAPKGKEGGLDVDYFLASVKDAPVAPAYLAWLRSSVALPDTVTLTSLKPQLKASGVDLDAIITSLSTVLQPAEMAALTQAATAPLKVDYTYSFDGRVAVEPKTGAEVATVASESLAAKPNLTSLVGLLGVLGKYPTSPQAIAASSALKTVAAAPATTLFKTNYQQTPASVTDIAGTVKSQMNRISVVRFWVPLGLFLAALIVLGIAAFKWFRGPTGKEEDVTPTPPQVTDDYEQIREPVAH